VICEKCNGVIRIVHDNDLGSCDTHKKYEADAYEADAQPTRINKWLDLLLLLLCAAGIAGLCYLVWELTGRLIFALPVVALTTPLFIMKKGKS